MFENALVLNKVPTKMKVTYKTVISAALIALAVILPQIIHAALGQPGGVKWLPMYLPVLLGGCLLGFRWGLAVGVLSPLVSFAITSLMGSPMPAANRLPFMMFELAVFALVSGLFTKLIDKNGLWAFPAVISAQIAGRGAFLLAVVICRSFAPFTPAVIRGQIVTGLVGLGVQAVLAPVIMIGLRALLKRDKKND